MFNFVYVNKFIAKYFTPNDKIDFEHPGKSIDSQAPYYKDCASAISLIDNHDRENITITSLGGIRLSGRFFGVEKSKKTVILFSDIDKDPITEFCLMITYYLSVGCNVLVPYQRGYYLSKAKYHSYGYLESFDLKEWINCMVSKFGAESEIYVHGIGVGANSICMACGLDLPTGNIKGFLLDTPFLGLKDFIGEILENDNIKDIDDMKLDIYKAIEKNLGFNIAKSSCIAPIKKCSVPAYFACKEMEGSKSSVTTQTLATFCPTTKETLVIPCDEFDADETFLVDRVSYLKLMKKFINDKA